MGHKTYDDGLPFQGLKKMQVMHQLKPLFKDKNIRPKACIDAITQLLYVIGQANETVTEEEAEDIFVASTMLFMNEDQKLRRMLYLIIKTLAKYSEQSYVAVNSLSIDMTKGQQKAPAIRTLRYIADNTTFGQLDRHLEQSIVDQNPAVASSGLISAYHMSDIDMEGVKRWQKKIQTQLSSRHHMVQYHALAVLYKLRAADTLAISKLVTSNTNTVRSRLGHSLLIRYAARVIRTTNDRQLTKTVLKYLTSCLTSYTSDIIVVEASKALCTLPGLDVKYVEPAVNALKNLIINSSTEPVKRYAAIKILSHLASQREELLLPVAHIIRDMISSPNRHIATLASTTLLVCISEEDIDSVLERLSTFITEIQDEYKMTVVTALKKLGEKYPKKLHTILSFFEKCLHEGGYQFRNAIFDGMKYLMNKNEDLMEEGLEYLVNFIEDCDYTKLLQRVLHYIGEVGPKSRNPSKFIRYLYNRIALENSSVRTAAVVALSKFAAEVESVRESVIVILKRILRDETDEVRDRAVLCLEALTADEDDLMDEILVQDLDVNVEDMERSLYVYLNHEETDDTFDKPFTLDSIVDNIAAEVKTVEEAAEDEEDSDHEFEAVSSPTKASSAIDVVEVFKNVEFMTQLGKPLKSTTPQLLTEPDADYVVSIRKHLYPNAVALHFNIKNGVDSQRILSAKIDLENGDDENAFDEENILSVATEAIRYGESENCVLLLPKSEDGSLALGRFTAALSFTYQEVDPSTGDIEDDEAVEEEVDLDEEVVVSLFDYLKDVPTDSFKADWNKLDEDDQWESDVISLPSDINALDDALTFVESRLNLNCLSSDSPKEQHLMATFSAMSIHDESYRVLFVTRYKMKGESVQMKVVARAPSQHEQLETAFEALSH